MTLRSRTPRRIADAASLRPPNPAVRCSSLLRAYQTSGSAAFAFSCLRCFSPNAHAPPSPRSTPDSRRRARSHRRAAGSSEASFRSARQTRHVPCTTDRKPLTAPAQAAAQYRTSTDRTEAECCHGEAAPRTDGDVPTAVFSTAASTAASTSQSMYSNSRIFHLRNDGRRGAARAPAATVEKRLIKTMSHATRHTATSLLDFVCLLTRPRQGCGARCRDGRPRRPRLQKRRLPPGQQRCSAPPRSSSRRPRASALLPPSPPPPSPPPPRRRC